MDNENSSIFKSYQKYECWRGEKQVFLKNSIGRQLPYIVNFKRNTCQIFDIELERITHSFVFPEGCILIDVDYFPTEEGQLGILVGVEDPRRSWDAEHFVVALAASSDSPTMEVTHSAKVPTRITVLKTLLSSADMSDESRRSVLRLYHRLMRWHHVVAIGCKETQCHLARLTPVVRSADPAITIHNDRSSLINLMAAFTDGSSFQYTLDDGSYRMYPTSGVYVSALSLMPRSRTLLVGLSMGGILAASLNPSNQMILLELRNERLIRRIAPLEPEDDPDKFEYFIAAVDNSPRHPIMIQLWRGSFKTLDQVDEEERFDRPHFNVCLEYKIPFGEKWLAVSPIVTEREHMVTARRRSGAEDSMLNASQSFGAAAIRSSVLLAYERKKLVTGAVCPEDKPEYLVEAAVFDIDAWYYKRVPGRVSTDDTVLRQCAFLSSIKSQMRSEDVNDIAILTLDATDVSRFHSMISDADQLFYPSAFSYERVFVATSCCIEWMKIQNIQDTIIEKCASKLPYLIQSPQSISAVIIAAGLVRKSIISGSPNSSATEQPNSQLTSHQKVLLNLVAYYGIVEEFCQLAARPDVSDQLKSEIAEWALHEAIDFKLTISDKMVSLFQGRSAALSPLAEDSIMQGIKLFRVVYEYLKTCSKELKNSRLRSWAHSVNCIRSQTMLISQFIRFAIIPVNQEVQKKMRAAHSKKRDLARRNSSTLPVQSVVRNINRIAPNAQFWNCIPHDEWYPPTPLDLLESILNVNISERLKRELVVQYVIDWIRASSYDDNELSDRHLALETIKVMTNLMLNVSLEKVYYVLEQEKTAIENNESSEVGKRLGEKVFSMHEEILSYEQFWGGTVPMMSTINKHDLERFETRLKMQLEGGKCRMPVLDPESEILYQVFLFETGNFDMMSAAAIEANDVLSKLPTGVLKNKERTRQKSRKEKEIEQSVKTMFAKSLKNDDEIAEMFATVTEKSDRKRRCSQREGSPESVSFSSGVYVPPTPKRISQWKKACTPATMSQSPVASNSSIASLQNFDDPNQNSEINMMIATPSRYYKRPMDTEELETELLSLTARKLPPVPSQNSILKTAKAVNSASRGRIRFHASVAKGPDESTEGVIASKGLALNFAILEDNEEEETMTKRKSRTIEIQEDDLEVVEVCNTNRKLDDEEIGEEEAEVETDEDECIEEEKSFECQEEFAINEDETSPNLPIAVSEETQQEETFEEQTDDLGPIDETFELSNEFEIKEKVEAKPQVEEEEDHIVHRSFEIQADEDCEPVESQDAIGPVESSTEVDTENVHEIAEDVPAEQIEEIPEDRNKQEIVTSEEVQEKEVIEDDSHRLSSAVGNKEVSAEMKIQQVVPSEIMADSEETDDRPPSRRTRSSSVRKDVVPLAAEKVTPSKVSTRRSTSRARTNSELLNSLFAEDDKKVLAGSSRRERTPSHRPSSTVGNEEVAAEMEIQQVVPSEIMADPAETDDRPPSRRTRSSSVRKDAVPLAAEKVTPSKVSNKRSTSRARTNSELLNSLFAEDDKKVLAESSRRARTPRKEINTLEARSATRKSVIRAQSAEPQIAKIAPTTPKRGRTCKSPKNTPISDSRKRLRSESELSETPTKRTRGRPRLTPLKAIPEDGYSVSDSGGDVATSSTTLTTPRRGRSRKNTLNKVDEEEEELDETKAQKTPLRRSSRHSHQ